MKKIFAIIYFIALTASYSANASQCPYQPTRSTQILAVIKKSSPKSAKKSEGIVSQKEVNHSVQVKKDMDEPETIIEDVKREEKSVLISEKINTDVDDNSNNHDENINKENTSISTREKSEEKLSKKEIVSAIKTEGHYVGFDMIANRLSWYERYKYDGIPGLEEEQKAKPSNYSYGAGMGLSYKYAFNFNDLFIAPGLFVEKIKASSEPTTNPSYSAISKTNGDLRVRGRYGAKIDVGYDLNKISPYFTIGYSMVKYTAENGFYDGDVAQSNLYKGVDGSLLYGLGVKINYDEKLSFNIEFNSQSFKAKTDTNTPNNLYGYVGSYDSHIRSLKAGFLYNF